MQKFVLTCCSTADLSRQYMEEKNIPFACFHYIIDGVEYPDDLGKTISFEEFYKNMANGAMPTTSQINTEQYCEFFEPFLKQGKDILHIALSSGISGSYNSARIASEDLSEKYPERKIYIVDSLAASSGFGLLVDAVAKLRDEGKTIDEAYAWTEENKLNVQHWFFTSDLTYLKRGGRISSTAAAFGTLLGICPLLNVSFEGKLVPRQKVRTKKKVIEEIVKKMEDLAQDGLNYSGKCYISNSACYEDARTVADLIEARFKNLAEPVTINSIGTVIGSHTGPGTVALFFFGSKRVD